MTILDPDAWVSRPTVTRIKPEDADDWWSPTVAALVTRPERIVDLGAQRRARRNWRWTVVAMIVLGLLGCYKAIPPLLASIQ